MHFIKVIFFAAFFNKIIFAQASSNFLNHWTGLESLETPNLTYENRNISIIIEEGGDKDGYYIYNSSSDFLFNEDLDWAYHYFGFIKDRNDELIFLRRFITPLGVLGYEELIYELTEWSTEYFVADYISDDGQSIHQIRMSSSSLDVQEILPIDFNLKQNYPNPFNPKTNIAVQNLKDGYGTLNIYDINGELIYQLFDGLFESGENIFIWKGTNNMGDQVSAGTYIYKLQIEGIPIQSKKMIYLK